MKAKRLKYRLRLLKRLAREQKGEELPVVRDVAGDMRREADMLRAMKYRMSRLLAPERMVVLSEERR